MDLERIEAALRSRPSDEPEYSGRLGIGVADELSGHAVRPRPTARARGAFGAAGAFALLAVVVAVAAIGLQGRAGGPGTADTSATPNGGTRLVQCLGSSDPGFPESALNAADRAETRQDAVGEAIRVLLESPSGGSLPKTGWMTVARTPDTAQVLAPIPEGGYWEIMLHRESTGAFTPTSWGSCNLMAALPGLAAATFTLDPAYPVNASAAEVHVLVQETSCSSGQPATGRIVPNVVYRGADVLVTIGVKPLLGAVTCQGSPPTPYALQLSSPLASRRLLDGATVPATVVVGPGGAAATPTPRPTLRPGAHPPTDCSGGTDVASFFKLASGSSAFDVYCPVLPAGWTAASYDLNGGVVNSVYVGPNGARLTLKEGPDCPAGAMCDYPTGDPAKFGDRSAIVYVGASGPSVLDASDGRNVWSIAGTGIGRDALVKIAQEMILVAK